MTEDMTRPRPPYLQQQRTRHGVLTWYVRVGRGPKIRIRGDYGSPAFMAAYRAAVEGNAPSAAGKPGTGTLAWLLERYRETAAWSQLSRATRRQRENIFKQVLKTAGAQPYSAITGPAIQAGIDRRAKTPAQARHFVEALRGLFVWAVAAGHMKADPTAGKMPQKESGDGFLPWTEEDVEAFRARWPLGSRQRLAMEIMLWTGLRRGDAAMFGRQHIKAGLAQLVTQKTGEQVFIPIEPELQAVIDATPTTGLTFIEGPRGPMTKESFGNWFRIAARAAGLDKSCHGLRKAGAERDAERGWTEAELDAKYGWRGGRMAGHYTKKANRRRLATAASERTRKRTSMPPPQGEVVATFKKSER